MDIVQIKNIAALLTARLAAAFTNVVAGGAGNNTSVVGLTIDRGSIRLPQSAAVVFPFQAQLGAGQTLSISSAKVRHSADGATWSDWQALTLPNAGLLATGPAGGGAVSGEATASVLLDGALQFMQVDFTPVLSAATADTAVIAALAVFGGFDRLPAPL